MNQQLTPQQRTEVEKFLAFIEKVIAIVKERDELRAELESLKVPKSNGYLAEVLQRALDGKKGWREEARKALGLQTMIRCESCGKLFPSGGKRKKNCGCSRNK